MRVMVSNATGLRVGMLVERYPGMLGHLYSPGGQRGPWPELPYALDNGAFPAFTKGEAWDSAAHLELLMWAKNSGQAPLWALVPDVVGDRAATIAKWNHTHAAVAAFGWPLAFAVQDGMTPADVPRGASVVFVGGSTEWKWATVSMWAKEFPRTHVGRVNTYRWLRVCEDAGVESVDGTGWFRANENQREGLEQWLREVTGRAQRPAQQSLSFDGSAGEMAHGSACSAIVAPAPAGGRK